MAVAGWYGDPTRSGRLRYWDGTAWTEHVSEGGGTAVEPITGAPPSPPSGPPAGAEAETATEAASTTGTADPVGATEISPVVEEPAAAPAPAPAASPALAAEPAPPSWQSSGPLAVPAGTPYPPTLVGRGGLVLAAIGGILTAVTSGMTAVDQGIVTISVAGGNWIGVIAAVLCLAAAAAPWAWARVAGVTVAGAIAVLVAAALIGFRTSDDLIEGIDVSLGPAGWLMFVGSLLLFLGTAIALWRFRVPAAGPDPSRSPAKGKSVVSLILGILGVVFGITAAPAIALGLMGLDDATVDEGVGGRGLARAGIILGIVFLVAWGVGLLLYALLAQP